MKREEQLDLKKSEYEGKVYPSNRFGDIKVLEYKNNKQVVIMFLNTGFITEESMGVIRSGHIRDSSLPTTCGFGYIDIEGASIGRNAIREYRLWNAMITRCYNENLRFKHESYKDCHVSEEWRYLSNFKDWCHQQIGFDQEGFHLDKDILVKGNKVYSPETCCFVPPEINGFLLNGNSYRGDLPVGVVLDKGAKKPRYRARLSKYGKYHCYGSYSNPTDAFIAYKQAKEDFAKELAEKWKDQIDPRAYNALMKYQVEITD